MRLFYAPGACSLAPHIALREAGLPFELDKVDFNTYKTDTGRDYKAVNPKALVPALQLDNGDTLTEGPAIMLYIADLAPLAKLAPPASTPARYRLYQWLAYISSELHKGYGNPKHSNETPDVIVKRLTGRFAYVNEALGNKTWLIDETYSLADLYLYVVLRWAPYLKLEVPEGLALHSARVAARPAVQAALKAEGLA